jgi:hypothetical protein
MVWRQIDEQEASTGAAAVRKTRTSQRQRGNEYPTGTRYKALAYHSDAFQKFERSGRLNPSRSTKAQKREKAAKTAAKRRVAVALAKFLKQANPAMKTAGATVTRLKGGGFTIRPIKAVKRR